MWVFIQTLTNVSIYITDNCSYYVVTKILKGDLESDTDWGSYRIGVVQLPSTVCICKQHEPSLGYLGHFVEKCVKQSMRAEVRTWRLHVMEGIIMWWSKWNWNPATMRLALIHHTITTVILSGENSVAKLETVVMYVVLVVHSPLVC